jgi:hypothetical protein
MVVAFASDDAFLLGVLSARFHTRWSVHAGGWLGVGNDPRYSKSRCFDPFPFPDATDPQKAGIRAIAEELDAHRKRQQAAHPALTLTGMYNVLERLRAGVTPGDLTPAERVIFDDGLVLILKELHDRLDQAVAAAYGWPADLADEEILARLVALNKERAAEEARGLVRWLRPEYQIPRFGTPTQKAQQIEADLVSAAEKTQKPLFPTPDGLQTAAVMAALAGSAGPLDSSAIAAGFRQGKRIEPKVRAVLIALARMGYVASADGGRSFMLPRAA